MGILLQLSPHQSSTCNNDILTLQIIGPTNSSANFNSNCFFPDVHSGFKYTILFKGTVIFTISRDPQGVSGFIKIIRLSNRVSKFSHELASNFPLFS